MDRRNKNKCARKRRHAKVELTSPGGNSGRVSTTFIVSSTKSFTYLDEQYTPRASSTLSFPRPNKGRTHDYSMHDETFLERESSTLGSDEDASSIDETTTRTAPEKWLSRIMSVSRAAAAAAAARQREAFGITSLDLEDHRTDSSELPHADSDVSLMGGDRWQENTMNLPQVHCYSN